MTFRFAPDVLEELDRIALYINQQSPGHGFVFLDWIEAALHRIEANPELYQVAFDRVRKAPIPHYPYVLLYEPRKSVVLVVDVIHTSRDPELWQRNREE